MHARTHARPHACTRTHVQALGLRAAGNMGTWLDTSALVTSVRNFPTERGKVVGLLKSFLGLSSSVYTTLYVAAFNEVRVSSHATLHAMRVRMVAAWRGVKRGMWCARRSAAQRSALAAAVPPR